MATYRLAGFQNSHNRAIMTLKVPENWGEDPALIFIFGQPDASSGVFSCKILARIFPDTMTNDYPVDVDASAQVFEKVVNITGNRIVEVVVPIPEDIQDALEPGEIVDIIAHFDFHLTPLQILIEYHAPVVSDNVKWDFEYKGVSDDQDRLSSSSLDEESRLDG